MAASQLRVIEWHYDVAIGTSVHAGVLIVRELAVTLVVASPASVKAESSKAVLE